MVKVAFNFRSQGIEKIELFSQGTEDCQKFEIRKSDYLLIQNV